MKSFFNKARKLVPFVSILALTSFYSGCGGLDLRSLVANAVVGKADFKNKEIPKVIYQLEQRIDEKNRSSFEFANDENGFLQPRLCIKDKDKGEECIYMTQILKLATVKGNDKYGERVIILYREPHSDGNLHAEKLRKTIVKINGDANLFGLYLDELKDKYSREKKIFLQKDEKNQEELVGNIDLKNISIRKVFGMLEEKIKFEDGAAFEVYENKGVVQPRIRWRSKDGRKEYITMDQITKVVRIRDKEQSEKNEIVLLYNDQETDGESKADVLKKKVITVTGDPNVAGLYLEELGKMYREKKIDSKQINENKQEEKIVYKTKIEKVKVGNSFSINESDLEKICNGEKEIVSGGVSLEVNYAGKVEFEDCEYSVKSGEAAEAVIKNIAKKYSEQKDGAIIFCGNATKPSAVNCPQFKNFDGCNGKLTMDRATVTSAYLRGLLEDKMTRTSFIPYPNDIKLDERSVKVFYVLSKDSK